MLLGLLIASLVVGEKKSISSTLHGLHYDFSVLPHLNPPEEEGMLTESQLKSVEHGIKRLSLVSSGKLRKLIVEYLKPEGNRYSGESGYTKEFILIARSYDVGLLNSWRFRKMKKRFPFSGHIDFHNAWTNGHLAPFSKIGNGLDVGVFTQTPYPALEEFDYFTAASKREKAEKR